MQPDGQQDIRVWGQLWISFFDVRWLLQPWKLQKISFFYHSWLAFLENREGRTNFKQFQYRFTVLWAFVTSINKGLNSNLIQLSEGDEKLSQSRVNPRWQEVSMLQCNSWLDPPWTGLSCGPNFWLVHYWVRKGSKFQLRSCQPDSCLPSRPHWGKMQLREKRIKLGMKLSAGGCVCPSERGRVRSKAAVIGCECDVDERWEQMVSKLSTTSTVVNIK